MKKRDPTIDAVVAMLSAMRITYDLDFNRGHAKFRFKVNGHKLQYFTGGTSSDKRAAQNAEHTVRRIIRQAQQEPPHGRLDATARCR